MSKKELVSREIKSYPSSPRIEDPEVQELWLDLRGPGRIELACPSLVELVVIHGVGELELYVESTPTLKFFELAGKIRFGCGELPWVRNVELSEHHEDFTFLARLPRLTRLSVKETEDVAPFDGIDTLVQLHMYGLRTSGSPLKRWKKGLKSLRVLNIAGAEMETLDGVEGCPRLEKFIAGYSDIGDVSALAKCSRLRNLHLQGSHVPNLHPLAELPLEMLSLGATRVGLHQVPDSLLGAVRPKGLQKKLRRERSIVRPARRYGSVGKQVARLKKLLLTRDFEKIGYAIHLMESLNDPELYDALLEGVDVEEIEGHDKGDQSLLPNTIFRSGPVLAPYRQHALRMLVAQAPPESQAAPLRERVTSLVLDGTSQNDSVAVDLQRLEAFKNLRRLEVFWASNIQSLEVLQRLHLDKLRLSVVSLEPFRPGPCKDVALHGIGRMGHLFNPLGSGAGWEHVERLELGYVQLANFRSIAKLVGLKEITIYYSSSVDLSALADLPDLKTVKHRIRGDVTGHEALLERGVEIRPVGW